MNKNRFKHYLTLNKPKLLLSLKFIYLVEIVFILVILGISIYSDQFPETETLVKIGICAFIFPIILFVIIILLSFYNMQKKNKILKPLDRLKFKISDIVINQNTKWFFTDFAKSIIVNEHEIICLIDDLSMDSVQFKLNIQIDNYSKKQKILSHKEKLNQENINLSPYLDSVTKFYKIKKFRKLDDPKREKELLSFVNKIETQYL